MNAGVERNRPDWKVFAAGLLGISILSKLTALYLPVLALAILNLPRERLTDRARRRKAGVPKEITFKTKPAIALDHLRWALACRAAWY
jgi:hypothetical protein